MKFTDQLNRTIQIHEPPTRIISLVPSLTELVCDLGLKSSLVGVTKFCVHPKNIRNTATVVGGTKHVHFDKIHKLNPEIILCNKEENTQEIIQELEQMAPVHISDINTIDDCLEIISMYGEIFQINQEAESICCNIRKEQSQFESFVSNQPKHSFVYFIWKDPWMAVGNNTFIDYMLNLNGFTNHFGNQSRYPEIDLNIIYPEVDLVLLSSEPYPFQKEHFKFLQPQFPNAKIQLVDGEMFSWYGSRLIKAFKYFKTLHRDILI